MEDLKKLEEKFGADKNSIIEALRNEASKNENSSYGDLMKAGADMLDGCILTIKGELFDEQELMNTIGD